MVIDWMFSVNFERETGLATRTQKETHRKGVFIHQKASTSADAEVNATNFGGTSFSPGVRVWVAGLEQC